MSRLKSLLHVATPSTCNTQQVVINAETRCTLHQNEELKRLVCLVSDHHGFSEEDYEEALTHAMADPVNALNCFTSLTLDLKENKDE